MAATVQHQAASGINSVGEYLKRQMLREGLTASDLAAQLHVHSQTIYNLTTGKRDASPKLAVKLAKRFGNPVEFWLGARLTAEPNSSVVEFRPATAGRAIEHTGIEPGSRRIPANILVDAEIRSLVNQVGSGLAITPFNLENLSPASYDLSIGIIVSKGFSRLRKNDWDLLVRYVSNDETLTSNEFAEAEKIAETSEIAYEKEWTLDLHQAVGVVLREKVNFSGNFLARVGGTTENTILGLSVGHGLQIDPGYSGPILITAFNIGLEPINLKASQKILSLEIVRLDVTPDQRYRDDITIKLDPIVVRLRDELAGMFEYEEVAAEERYNITIKLGSRQTHSVDGKIIDEARDQAVRHVVENLLRDHDHEAFLTPFKKALGQVTVGPVETEALTRRFLSCTVENKQNALDSLKTGTGRKPLGEILKDLGLDCIEAVAGLMNIK